MTPEQVFRYCRTYKLFYSGQYDFNKYRGGFKMPPLINQPERRFYYKFAQKLNDDQIHALFTVGYFFNPRAHVTDLSSPAAITAAVEFAARAENGKPKLEADLYTVQKRLRDGDVDTWLYGECVGGQRALMPPVLQEVINGELAIDTACLILLIPQPLLSYNWPKTMQDKAPAFLGPAEWIKRLFCADQLIRLQRPGWRALTYGLATEFWTSLSVTDLAPREAARQPVSLDI